MSKKRLVVTGSSGWVGKSLLANYHKLNFDSVMLLGSKNQQFTVDGKVFYQYTWTNDAILDFKPTHLIHLAAITRDKLSTMSIEEYCSKYQHLLNLLESTLSFKGLTNSLLFSSGAADFTNYSDNSNDHYANFKSREEKLAWTLKGSSNTVNVLRVYSLSGRFVNKIDHLAFSSYIKQAKYTGKIKVRAGENVIRQFIDAEELILKSLKLLEKIDSNLYTSGGIKINLHNLAKIIANKYYAEVEFYREISSNSLFTRDNYTSDFNILPGADESNVLSINNQINKTAGVI